MSKNKAILVIEGIICATLPLSENLESEFRTRCYKSAITLLDLHDDTHLLPLLNPEDLIDIFIKFLLGGNIEEFINEVHSLVPSDSKH